MDDESGTVAGVEALLATARDDDGAFWRVEGELRRMGRAVVVPLLRRVRRDGPGRLRRPALHMLTEIAGEEGLSEQDRRIIERLIRVKLLDEKPTPVIGCWTEWIAVPSDDRQSVMDLLGLHSPRPATMALGRAVIDNVTHDAFDSPATAMSWVFVTPVLRGWTLFVGAWCSPVHEGRRDHVLRLCERLSAAYGQAHAYYYGAQGDGSAWLVAENSTVIRRYCASGEPDDAALTIGPPLPYEQQRRSDLGLPTEWGAGGQDGEEEWESTLWDLVPDLSDAISVSPLWSLTAECPAHGAGMLALTPDATAQLVPPGHYEI